MSTIYRSVEQLKVWFDEVTQLRDIHNPGIAEDLRAEDLDPSQTVELKSAQIKIEQFGIARVDKAIALFLLGAETPKEGEYPTFTLKGESYVERRNLFNRIVRETTIAGSGDSMANVMKRGLWVLSDPIVLDWNLQVMSGQHRLKAMVHAIAAGMIDPVDFYLVVGRPPQFRDLLDKGNSRSVVADDDYVDQRVMPLNMLLSIQAEQLAPSDWPKFRQKRVKSYNTVRNDLLQRLGGADIHAGGGKHTYSTRKALSDRFQGLQGVVTIGTDEKLWECNSLEMLVAECYENASNGDLERHWSKRFEPNVLATALVLESNRDDYVDSVLESMVRSPEESPEEFQARREQKQRDLLQGKLRLDNEFIQWAFSQLNSSIPESGPMAGLFTILETKIVDEQKAVKASKTKLWSKYSDRSMGVLVDILKQLRTAYEQYGAEAIPSEHVWSSPWIDKKEFSKTDGNKVYRCFGGVDIGFTPNKRGKKASEASE